MFFINYKFCLLILFFNLAYFETFSSELNDTIVHNVGKGETLFSISKKYNLSIDDLKNWNNLRNNNLSVNQKIIVITQSANIKSERTEKTYEEKFPGILKEEGFASSIEEPMESTKYLALHKSAKVGTILFVRNQMNDLKVMVRVIGKLPDTGSNQKIVIRLSKIAFSKLDPIDPIIPVELSYLEN
ncbi:MAG: hypothetical protein CMB92_04595 [Flammeovirgaceae bacterium]|nr:hypothetical protein [Flammeovirgaceae bacterium]|tara:strand:- start:1116 stop:1673 length:558 start_codon:yes stop_codon:yes gene_type:complete